MDGSGHHWKQDMADSGDIDAAWHRCRDGLIFCIAGYPNFYASKSWGLFPDFILRLSATSQVRWHARQNSPLLDMAIFTRIITI
jgi:hypothetical protein